MQDTRTTSVLKALLIAPLFLFLFIRGSGTLAAPSPAPVVDDLRSKIGSVFSAPVKWGGKLYFVSTTGVLYESDPELKTVKKLHEGKMRSSGALTASGNTLYWGEGLFEDRKTVLHSYDLKSRKILKELKIEGHVDRPVLVTGDALYVPMGPGGIARFEKTSGKQLWRAKSRGTKLLHIDSNLIEYQDEVCAATVDEVKGVICFQKSSGKETRFHELKKDPKGLLALSGDLISGFATTGNLIDPKFDIPSDFYVVDLKARKLRFVKELRGFNFFAPSIEGTDAFLTLSTGDFILLNLETEKITFLGEHPEPFINPSFRMDSEYCGIGIMGKFNCYTKTQNGAPAISKDTRILETVIGEVTRIDSRLYLPTRIGFVVQ
jgi:hypothetical protein